MASKLCPFCMRMAESEICPHCSKNIDYAGSPTHLPAGYVVHGKHPYVMGAALGQGGFGVTYTLMEDATSNLVFGSAYRRSQISSITFLSTTADATANSWDVSQAQDGSVLAWMKPNGDLKDLYIGAAGGVIAPQDCSNLFAGYFELSAIHFNNALDTRNTTNMSYMFHNCDELSELDLSHFDTGKVTNMNGMFENCNSLNSVDVSSFDTSNVTHMQYMFALCNNLSKLDLSGFNTSGVTDMAAMFQNCSKLVTLDLSNFDVSNVKRYDRFMDEGKTIDGRPWEEFFTK